MSDAERGKLRLFGVGLCAWIFLAAFSALTLAAAPAGPNKIALPLELIADEPATIAVLGSDGHVAPGVKIVLSSGQVLTTDESGRAHFLVPPQTGPLFARILGSEIRVAADVLPEQPSERDFQLAQVPKMASVSDRLVITGSGFEGDADKNSVEIDGTRALVLASSPAQLLAMPPADTVLGPATVLLTEGNSEATANLIFVSIIPMSSSYMQVRRGKTSTIALLVQGTVEPVSLKVRDLTPQVSQFEGNDTLFVRTIGGPDNSAIIRIKGLAAGQFSYSVRLEADYRRADAPVASDFLRAAERMANTDVSKKIKSILTELKRKNPDSMKLLEDLQNLAGFDGPSDFRALICAAERSLGGF